MSWRTLPPHVRQAAEHALTRKQLDVLKLHLAGCGTRRIATMLSISEPTAREHLRRAKARLNTSLEEPAA
jgi:DNA-binding CsgD family transcriptional regulator